jgi:hypothetical protein
MHSAIAAGHAGCPTNWMHTTSKLRAHSSFLLSQVLVVSHGSTQEAVPPVAASTSQTGASVLHLTNEHGSVLHGGRALRSRRHIPNNQIRRQFRLDKCQDHKKESATH